MTIEQLTVTKIVSETGYFRRIETGEVFGGQMYLGKYDAPENYEEITEEEYLEAKNQERENIAIQD